MQIDLLPPDRWPELAKALEESRSDEQLPKPGNSVILGAFEGDQLVGAIGAERVWLVSPFWVQKEYRGNGLAQQLAHAIESYNREGLKECCATTSRHVERLIYSMGFIPIQGQLWRRDVK